jgi:type IV pilus assembly protein PilN
MIRINLYPLRKKKKPRPVPGFVVAAVMVLVLTAVVTFYLNYFMKSRIKDLEAQKAANAEKIARLQEKIKEVKNFEALNQKFKERKQIIEELRRNQARPVKVLDELSTRLSDGVWLSDLTISGDAINFNGIGFTNDDVVTLVQNLKASALFSDVYLHETTKSQAEGVDVYRFRVSMKIKV